MDKRLNIQVGFVNTAFQAIDNSEYSTWEEDDKNHMVLQRLVKIDGGEDVDTISKSIEIATTIEQLQKPFVVDNVTSGWFCYQKILIPAEDHITEANSILYFDSDNIVHYKDLDSGIDETFNPIENDDDFEEIYDLVNQNDFDNCFLFDDYAFTIYDVVECYIRTERDRLAEYFKTNCQSNCSLSSELESNADILLAAVLVLRHLIETEDYAEALRILNGLDTCGRLCKKYSKSLNGCGCGKA